MTSFYTQDLLLSHIQPSSAGGPHPSAVPTHNILKLFQLTTSFSCSNSQHHSAVPTHNILQLFQITTSFSSSNSQHPSGLPTHNILQLFQITTSFSCSNSQHPAAVPTHNIIHLFQVTTPLSCSKSQHPSAVPTHILQLFQLTTSFSCSNSQHPSALPTHNILQLFQLTTSFSCSNSQHPTVVQTHNSLHQIHTALFYHYMNILCLSRDLSRIAYSLGSSTVGSHPTSGLDMCLHFSFSCCLVDVEIMRDDQPFSQTSNQMFKNKIQKNGNRVDLDGIFLQLHRGSYKLTL